MPWPWGRGGMWDLLLFGWNEAEHEDVALAAVVALEDGFAQRRVAVERDLLAFGPARGMRTQNMPMASGYCCIRKVVPYEMVYDAATREFIAAAVTKPLS